MSVEMPSLPDPPPDAVPAGSGAGEVSKPEPLAGGERSAVEPGAAAEPPIFPGFPGYDPTSPAAQLMREVNRIAASIACSWYRFPPLAKAASHRGVSLLEATDFHFGGPILRALLVAVSQAEREQSSGAPDRTGQ